MKSKDKGWLKVTLKNIIYTCCFLMMAVYIILFYNLYFTNNKSYAVETTSKNMEFKLSNALEVDLDTIIKQNINDEKKEQIIQEEQVLEYITKYQTNNELPKGMVQVIQEGREGKQIITKKRTFENNNIILEEQIGAVITKASIDKIVEIGGASYTSNYKVKVGDSIYVTSDRLAVMVEPTEESKKVATLSTNDELKLLEIQGSWYRISHVGITGWVKSECTTYINPNNKIEEIQDNQSQKTKSQLLANLNFNMQLNKPSGLSLEQFKKVLTDSKDVNKIFINNAEYFYYIEKQYNINGIFVASIGIHESAWGTSKIARDKNNLFGYGANDSNPYNGAYTFSNYSESIDLLARVLVKYYLNPKGTSIYGGEKAVGTYYNGPTITGVNTKYASDKNWGNCVYTYMSYLYNKL